jgi:uracil-DNA glycosylase
VIGEQPDFWDVKQGECFAGQSGMYLQDVYLQEALLSHFSVVYYGNAIRCMHRRNIAVTHLAQCRPYLMHDIRTLLACHGQLVMLALGRAASLCLLNRGVREAFKVQGQPLPDAFWANHPRLKKGSPPIVIAPELLPSQQIRVFSTYHPRALMSGRNPSYRRAVFDHLALFCRSMGKEFTQKSEGPVDLEILRDVTWSRPGEKHRIPEPTE